MPAITFTATIQGGKIKFDSIRAWLTLVGQLEGEAIEVTIKKQSKRKSTQANRYYWGVVVEYTRMWLTDTQGEEFTTEEAHELLKQRNNASEIKSGMGTVVIGRTTKGMESDEFTAYIDRCIKWLYNISGIIVPSSDEYRINNQ